MMARSEVLAFAEIMERKLLKHDDRGGWQDCSLLCLLLRLREKDRDLVRAIEHGSPDDIAAEAADVANLAMMMADVVGALDVRRVR